MASGTGKRIKTVLVPPPRAPLSETSRLLRLPLVLVAHVCAHLETRDYAVFSRTSKTSRSVMRHPMALPRTLSVYHDPDAALAYVRRVGMRLTRLELHAPPLPTATTLAFSRLVPGLRHLAVTYASPPPRTSFQLDEAKAEDRRLLVEMKHVSMVRRISGDAASCVAPANISTRYPVMKLYAHLSDRIGYDILCGFHKKSLERKIFFQFLRN